MEIPKNNFHQFFINYHLEQIKVHKVPPFEDSPLIQDFDIVELDVGKSANSLKQQLTKMILMKYKIDEKSAENVKISVYNFQQIIKT